MSTVLIGSGGVRMPYLPPSRFIAAAAVAEAAAGQTSFFFGLLVLLLDNVKLGVSAETVKSIDMPYDIRTERSFCCRC